VKVNWKIVVIVFVVLIFAGIYSYRKIEYKRNNGVYTLGEITSVHLARNGWKIHVNYRFSRREFSIYTIVFFEGFSPRNIGRRYFVKILPENPGDGLILVPGVEVPDSVQLAPDNGWSEDWMKEHFPKAVEYVYDTR